MSGVKRPKPTSYAMSEWRGLYDYTKALEAYADAADALIERVGQHHLSTTQGVADFHRADAECAAWGKRTEDEP